MVGSMTFLPLKQIGCGMHPCLPVPNVSYGFRAHTVLCSKQDTVADFLAEQIWS